MNETETGNVRRLTMQPEDDKLPPALAPDGTWERIGLLKGKSMMADIHEIRYAYQRNMEIIRSFVR